MVYSLVLLALGTLLLLIIIYNIIQQYKERVEAERRALILKHKAVIDETDEALLYASRLPFSQPLVLLLYRRILASLETVRAADPKLTQVTQRCRDIAAQIQHIEANYQEPDESIFRSPESDREALQLLQTVKKIRAIVRTEHRKGKLSPTAYQQEDHKLELLQVKINVDNAIKRALEARVNSQFGTAKQLLTKGLGLLEKIDHKDDYIKHKIAEIKQTLADIDESQRQSGEQQRQAIKEKEVDELDVLFQPKRKW